MTQSFLIHMTIVDEQPPLECYLYEKLYKAKVKHVTCLFSEPFLINHVLTKKHKDTFFDLCSAGYTDAFLEEMHGHQRTLHGPR